MRAPFHPLISVVLALLGGACQRWSTEGTLRLVIELDPDLRSECVLVRLNGAAGALTSDPISRPLDRLTPLIVAVAQGGLSSDVTVQATGYTAGCQREEDPPEFADAVPAHFKPFPPNEVSLRLSVHRPPVEGGGLDGGPTDGGELPDSGENDSGVVDGGAPDSGAPDGGPPDSGGGVKDAGVEDAGAPCSTCVPGEHCNLHQECVPAFSYEPSNFNEQQLDFLTSTVTLEVTTAFTIDTQTSDGGVEARLADGGVVELPFAVIAQLDGGSSAALLHARSFHVGDAGLLEVVGERPLLIVVRGDALVDGTIITRAGADRECATPGANHSFDGDAFEGGGGAGFGQSGGSGATFSPLHGVGQAPSGTAFLAPLRGGCRAGAGGPDAGTTGGLGGGGLQVSAVGRVLLNGVIAAPGRGGKGAPTDNGGGGGGGGSGGALLLEGRRIVIGPGGRLTANGGGGGQGSSTRNGSSGSPGADGLISSAANADGGLQSNSTSDCAGEGGQGGSASGDAGAGQKENCTRMAGGGGGGGAVGRIRLNALEGCEHDDGGIVSPQATGSGAGC